MCGSNGKKVALHYAESDRLSGFLVNHVLISMVYRLLIIIHYRPYQASYVVCRVLDLSQLSSLV